MFTFDKETVSLLLNWCVPPTIYNICLCNNFIIIFLSMNNYIFSSSFDLMHIVTEIACYVNFLMLIFIIDIKKSHKLVYPVGIFKIYVI